MPGSEPIRSSTAFRRASSAGWNVLARSTWKHPFLRVQPHLARQTRVREGSVQADLLVHRLESVIGSHDERGRRLDARLPHRIPQQPDVAVRFRDRGLRQVVTWTVGMLHYVGLQEMNRDQIGMMRPDRFGSRFRQPQIHGALVHRVVMIGGVDAERTEMRDVRGIVIDGGIVPTLGPIESCRSQTVPLGNVEDRRRVYALGVWQLRDVYLRAAAPVVPAVAQDAMDHRRHTGDDGRVRRVRHAGKIVSLLSACTPPRASSRMLGITRSGSSRL
jgi:hypothetical protein